jgi:isopropylmalate/homocitrate/citramalate synthase
MEIMKIKLLDSTLREGRQSINHTELFKILYDYIELVNKIGIKDMEFINPFSTSSDFNIFKNLVAKFPNTNFYAHGYLNMNNMNMFLNEDSISYISTFIPFPINNESILCLKYLLKNSKGKKIRIGIENAPSYSKKNLTKIFFLLSKFDSVSRIGILDTLGILTPKTTLELTKTVNNIFLDRSDLEFHFHNDFGLAAGNAFIVINNLKKIHNNLFFGVSVFGLGERNGILSIGDMFSIYIKENIINDYSFTYYGELLNFLESKNLIFNRDPICKNSFNHFANSHILGELEKNKYSVITPTIFGLKNEYIFNSLTGGDIYISIAKNSLKFSQNIDKINLKKYIVKNINLKKEKYLYYNEVIILIKKYLKIK